MRKGILVTIVIVAAGLLGFRLADNDYFFKINKSIDIYGSVYRELALNYVDETDPEHLMVDGIEGMLGSLDPYTNYIAASEGDEMELITTGQYGGIGISIGVRDNYITVISVMEGYSAQREGLLPGDQIIDIDGKNIIGMKPDEVRSLTRGDPGSQLHMKVKREGETEPVAFILTREQIQLKNVTYADYVGDGIGYIKLEHFSRSAGDEVLLAIKDLKLKGTMKGIILDLRDNPGGLLDAAIEIVERFVPRGSLIVSTRGRRPDSEKKYTAAEDPMLPDVPLVVIVNRNSASASEVVAGAIQDLDRGIILGTRSFGKGLVQTVVPLAYGSQLKITTAKYYTPSGRCIQEIDYQHRDDNGAFTITADSLRHEFKTSHGRRVFELGGVHPDTIVDLPTESVLLRELKRKLMIIKFAGKYVAAHKIPPSSFTITDSMLDEFKSFAKEASFSYEDSVEKKFTEVEELSSRAKYDNSIVAGLATLRKQLVAEKEKNFDRDKIAIAQVLREEIMSRYHGERGRLDASLGVDVQVQAAKLILRQPTQYAGMLKLKSELH